MTTSLAMTAQKQMGELGCVAVGCREAWTLRSPVTKQPPVPKTPTPPLRQECGQMEWTQLLPLLLVVTETPD